MPQIENISLVSSVFVDNDKSPEKILYQLRLTSYQKGEIQCVKAEDGTEKYIFRAVALFDLMCEVKDPAMAFFCGYQISYSGDTEEEFKVLSDPIILAHIFPYLREHVSNMTMRSRFPTLFLESVNTHQLFEEFQNTSKAASEKQTDTV